MTAQRITEADIAASEAAIQASRNRLKRYDSHATLKAAWLKEEADLLEAQLRLDGLRALAGQDVNASTAALEAKLDMILDKLAQGAIYAQNTPVTLSATARICPICGVNELKNPVAKTCGPKCRMEYNRRGLATPRAEYERR